MAAPRTQFYHPAKVIDAALQGAERAIRRSEGVVLVVGPAGTGKSLLLAMLAEHVREDFDVALLSGARICTRRALWQSILAEIGEPYKGIDEAELRLAVVERIRSLAATGSGLVVLVDEAHTLPTRLLEELRLLTNVPTPLPAVHIVLAGSTRVEEMLGLPRMASLAQRIAVRSYLEPLDHAETIAYLRTQTRAAGLDWDGLFETGCDDAVFRLTDGVPRLVNQVCDHALVLAGDSGRRVTTGEIAAAWNEIQRLPVNGLAGQSTTGHAPAAGTSTVGPHDGPSTAGSDSGLAAMIEFGALEDEDSIPAAAPDHLTPTPDHDRDCSPWNGPDVELVFDTSGDPFADLFGRGSEAIDRHVMTGPDDFGRCPRVNSRDDSALAADLLAATRVTVPRVAGRAANDAVMPPVGDGTEGGAGEGIDQDLVVIEDDLADSLFDAGADISPVRAGDYRSLFSRLRRGDAAG